MALYPALPVFKSRTFQFVPEVEIELAVFDEYLALTESVIQEQVTRNIFANDTVIAECEAKGVAPDLDGVRDYTIRHVQRLRFESLFIALFSFLERKLFDLSKIVEDNGAPLKVSDLAGEGIKKFRTFLSKLANIDFAPLNGEWDYITKIQKLRNLFVHASGKIADTNENKNRIETFDSLRHLNRNSADGMIEYSISTPDLIREFRQVINRFLRMIYYGKA